jgi:hypothetical protein
MPIKITAVTSTYTNSNLKPYRATTMAKTAKTIQTHHDKQHMVRILCEWLVVQMARTYCTWPSGFQPLELRSEAGYGQPDATMNGEHVSAADFIKSLPLQTAVPSGKGKSPLAEVGHNQSSRTAGDQKGLGKKQHRQRQSLGKGKGKDKGKGKGKASMPTGRRGGKGGKSKGKPVA